MSLFPLSRRSFLTACAAAPLLPMIASAEEPQLSDDGLYQQPWFLQSFLDLREDFHAAQTRGKSFVLLWELKGCPYCKLLHSVNFANPKIASYARDNFDFLQLNLVGARPVTDFDGSELPEKRLAERYQVSGTPTLQFFIAGPDGDAEEAGRTQYLKPAEFRGILHFVREKGYETTLFDAWLRMHPQSL